jgi:glycine hydroxymethyltransferase
MPALAHRTWVSEVCETFVQAIAEDTARATSNAIDASIERLIVANAKIHDVDCINLNPATNVLNPRAEAVLARGLGSRPSLGYPGNKYEMGLEAIERIG